MSRIQHRRGNGQFRQSALSDIGLGNEICGQCGQCHPFKIGIEKPPHRCESCGELLGTIDPMADATRVADWQDKNGVEF